MFKGWIGLVYSKHISLGGRHSSWSLVWSLIYSPVFLSACPSTQLQCGLSAADILEPRPCSSRCLGWDRQGQLTLTFPKQILHLRTRAVIVDGHFKTQASEALEEGLCVFVCPIADIHTCGGKARSGVSNAENRLQSDQVPCGLQ